VFISCSWGIMRIYLFTLVNRLAHRCSVEKQSYCRHLHVLQTIFRLRAIMTCFPRVSEYQAQEYDNVRIFLFSYSSPIAQWFLFAKTLDKVNSPKVQEQCIIVSNYWTIYFQYQCSDSLYARRDIGLLYILVPFVLILAWESSLLFQLKVYTLFHHSNFYLYSILFASLASIYTVFSSLIQLRTV